MLSLEAIALLGGVFLNLKEISEMIHADAIQNKGEGIKIAVCDTGFTPHSDIKNVVDGINFTADNDNNERDYRDGHSHGTHTTGIISYFVPESEIYICKVLNDNMIGLSLGLQQAIEYCVENEIRVINMSLSVPLNLSVMREYIKRAVRSDILVIASAGETYANCSRIGRIAYSELWDGVVLVGACDTEGRPICFSRSSNAHIIAPGIDIVSCDNKGGYTSKSGTSQAVPVVTAMAAKILSREPDLTVTGLYYKLMECTRDVWDNMCRQKLGLIDISRYTQSRCIAGQL